MKEKIALCVLIALLCVTSVFAQTKRKKSSASNNSKSVVGILYRVAGGAHMHYIFLNTPKGIINFTATTEKTRWTGFRNNDLAWNKGAEWRVVYRETIGDEKEAYGEAIAQSVAFTGRVDSSAVNAENLGYRYLDFLSDGNYRQAYAMLSQSAMQKLSFGNFQNLYRSAELVPRTVTICSHTNDKVSLLLEFEMGGNFQGSEIVRINGEWYIDKVSGFESGFDYFVLRC